MNDKSQKNQQDQKPKEQTFTLTEFNNKLVQELNRTPRVTYSIAHGYTNGGRSPKLEIRVDGGDPKKLTDLWSPWNSFCWNMRRIIRLRIMKLCRTSRTTCRQSSSASMTSEERTGKLTEDEAVAIMAKAACKATRGEWGDAGAMLQAQYRREARAAYRALMAQIKLY